MDKIKLVNQASNLYHDFISKLLLIPHQENLAASQSIVRFEEAFFWFVKAIEISNLPKEEEKEELNAA